MFDNARLALQQLTVGLTLERTAVEVLRSRYPHLRLVGPTGDTGTDAVARKLFDGKNEIALLISVQRRWGPKLTAELDKIEKTAKGKRPKRAIYVSTQRIREQDRQRYFVRAKNLGVKLEIFDIDELVFELETDALRGVAERVLGVRPIAPTPLQSVDAYLEGFGATVPGMRAPLVGGDDTPASIRRVLEVSNGATGRVTVVEGAGGSGKTRLSIDAATATTRAVLIAPPNVRLDVAAFEHVPLDEPLTVIVDDANQSSDLTGVTTMLADPRFRNVRVLLTCRQATTPAVLSDSGLARWASAPVLVPPMTSARVEQIVRSYGINDASHIAAVIEVADGSPLLAHAVCEEALTRRRLAWSDVADLLESRFQLASLGSRDDAVGATAVALAVRGTVRSATEVAALSAAIPQLPTGLADIDRALNVLADLGIVSVVTDDWGTAAYSLTPHVTAPVILARSLRAGERVRCHPRQALWILGQETLPETSPADPMATGSLATTPRRGGPLGVPALAGEGSYGLAGLATQLETFAVAASRNNDNGLASLLSAAVSQLLPTRPTVGAWTTVLVLSAPVARASPTLLDDLVVRMERAWPPEPNQDHRMWPGTTVEQQQRSDLDRLVGQLCGLADAAGATNPTATVRLLLTGTESLIDTVDSSTLRRVGTTIRNQTTSGAADDEQAGSQRLAVVAAISEWLHRRQSGRDASRSSGWARLGLEVLNGLLAPFDESARSGFADGSQVVQFTSRVLPDTPATYQYIDGCLTVLRGVVALLDPDDPSLLTALKRLIDLPYELRATPTRGMPFNGGPIPAYIGPLTTDVAAAVEGIVAGRWADLPDQVRHYAAAQTVRRGRWSGRYRTLAQHAAAGNPIAMLATDDAALRDLLVLVPIDVDEEATLSDTPRTRRSEGSRLDAASELAEQLSWREALALLRRSTDVPDSWVGQPPRAAFVRSVAARLSADDALQVLEDLGSQMQAIPNEEVLIEALVAMHGEAALSALFSGAVTERGALLLLDAFPVVDNPTRQRIAEQGMSVMMRHRDPGESGSHEHIDEQSTLAERPREPRRGVPADGLRSGLARVAQRLLTGQTPSPQRANPTQPSASPVATTSNVESSAQQVRPTMLAQALLDQVHRSDWDQRVSWLLEFGLRGPVALTPAVLRDITVTDRIQGRWPAVTEAQWGVTVAVLKRRLLADDPLLPDLYSDYDTAMSVRSLALHVPYPLADLLVERLTDDPDSRLHWPFDWQGALGELTPEQRIPLAAAFTQLIDGLGGADDLDDLARFEVDKALGQVGAGIDDWQDRLLRLAAGSPSDRTSVVSTIASMWRDPAWPEIVSTLLTRGLDADNVDRLVNGIDMRSFGNDNDARVQARLRVLGSLAPVDAPAVRAFVGAARQRIEESMRWSGSRDLR